MNDFLYTINTADVGTLVVLSIGAIMALALGIVLLARNAISNGDTHK